MSDLTSTSVEQSASRTATLKSYLRFLGIQDNELLCLVAINPRSDEMRRAATAACYVRVKNASLALQAAEDIEPILKAEGLYLLPGKIHPDVAARDLPATWTAGVEQPKDHEVVKRRVVVVDLDPKRIKGVSSTEEELALALEVAKKVFAGLKEVLGSDQSLALACSGNGFHVLLAVDLDTDTDGRSMDDPARPLVERLLAALGLLFGTDRVDVDRSVIEARRLFPAYGTMKCKGKSTEDRPHRRSTFPVVSERPPRLNLEQFSALVRAVEADLSEDQLAALDQGGTSRPSATTSAPITQNGESILQTCSKASMSDVLRALGQDPEHPTCPSCGHQATKGDTSVKVLGDEVLKCLHGTCGSYAAGPVGVVAMAVAGVESLKGDKASTKKVIEWFRESGLVQLPKGKRAGRPARTFSDEELERMGLSFERVDGEENAPPPEGENAPRRRNLTDAGNAERLIDLHGDEIRYVRKWKKWIAWTGSRWVIDDHLLEMRRRAKSTVRTIYEEAKGLSDATERRETAKWAQLSEQNARQKALIESAEHMAGIGHDELNRDPWL